MSYSNLGYVLLGYLLEKVSGEKYQDFIQKNIFDPLGMKDSGYDSNSAIIPRRAAGYRSGLSGVVNTMPFTCMPGTVVTALSKKLRKDFGNFPFLNLAYEGQEDANEFTRPEAFIHQAKEFQKRDRRTCSKRS